VQIVKKGNKPTCTVLQEDNSTFLEKKKSFTPNLAQKHFTEKKSNLSSFPNLWIENSEFVTWFSPIPIQLTAHSIRYSLRLEI
jgi:hypothetical protein